MDRNARDTYLETDVNTATPHKLRLMLIDGGLRFARLVLERWENDCPLEGRDACRRCRNILLELLSSLNTNDSEIAQQSADLYLFLIQSVTQAEIDNDPTGIHDVIRVLEIERRTWQEVCDKHPQATANKEEKREIHAPAKSIPPTDLTHRRTGDLGSEKKTNPFSPDKAPTKGLSLEG